MPSVAPMSESVETDSATETVRSLTTKGPAMGIN